MGRLASVQHSTTVVICMVLGKPVVLAMAEYPESLVLPPSRWYNKRPQGDLCEFALSESSSLPAEPVARRR